MLHTYLVMLDSVLSWHVMLKYILLFLETKNWNSMQFCNMTIQLWSCKMKTIILAKLLVKLGNNSLYASM